MLAYLLFALAPVEYVGDKAPEIKVYAQQPGGVYLKTLVMRTAGELNLATPIGGKNYDIVQITANMMARFKHSEVVGKSVCVGFIHVCLFGFGALLGEPQPGWFVG